jgi:hypothetical protein
VQEQLERLQHAIAHMHEQHASMHEQAASMLLTREEEEKRAHAAHTKLTSALAATELTLALTQAEQLHTYIYTSTYTYT